MRHRCLPYLVLSLLCTLTLGVFAQADSPGLGPIPEALRVLKEQGLGFDTGLVQRVAVEAMVTAVDPLGKLMFEKDFQELQKMHDGYFSAVGLRLAETNGRPRVVHVYEDTPAAALGIKPGDVIEGIEDMDTTNITATVAEQMLRGPLEETVHLTARREDGSVVEWDVERSWVQLPAIEKMEVFPEGICYIRVNNLRPGECSRALVQRLREAHEEEKFGMIIDLRGTHGRDLATVVDVATLFAEPGAMLFAIRDQADQDIEVYRGEDEDTVTMPVMVLIDEHSSGAAEVLAAVFRKSVKGAMLFGQTTAGDPTIREGIPLASGDVMYVATRRVVVADGTVYTGREGVKPDVFVDLSVLPEEEFEPEVKKDDELTQEEIDDKWLRERTRGDATLGRALDVLLGLKALNIRTVGNPTNTSP